MGMLSNNSLFGGQLQKGYNHKSTAQVIYVHTTDQQSVSYFSINHARKLIYCDSNKHKQ